MGNRATTPRAQSGAKFTPGPWRWSPGQSVIRALPPGSDRWVGIASVRTLKRVDGEVEQANARLIAAAPDLAEALRRIANTLVAAELIGCESEPTTATKRSNFDFERCFVKDKHGKIVLVAQSDSPTAAEVIAGSVELLAAVPTIARAALKKAGLA